MYEDRDRPSSTFVYSVDAHAAAAASAAVIQNVGTKNGGENQHRDGFLFFVTSVKKVFFTCYSVVRPEGKKICRFFRLYYRTTYLT